MNKRVKFDESVYNNMLDFLNLLNETEAEGTQSDIAFMNKDFWLQDTAVVENLQLSKGEWNVSLVFAHHLYPLKFIKRYIKNYACPKRASLAAHFMRRQAAKDQRAHFI